MSKNGINRREFVKWTSLGLIGGIIDLRPSLSVARMNWGGGNVINPPPGGPFKDPVELINQRQLDGVFESDLNVKIAPININGKTANLLTYNGHFPGPTIRVKKGDLLRVRFKNSLPTTGTLNLNNA